MEHLDKSQQLRGIGIFFLAALFLGFEMVLQVSPSVMTSQLMADFGINAAGLGVIASFYFYSYTFFQVPSGLLYDRFGPRLLITIACGLCSWGALFFGTTQSVFLLGLGRFLLGIGSAFAYIGALTVAARWFSPKFFALSVGIVQFVGCFGATCGALPLAFLVERIGWRSTITYLALLGFALTILCALFIRNRPSTSKETPREVHHHHLGFFKSLRAVVLEKQSWALGFYSFFNWAPALIFPALWGVPYLMGKYNLPNTTAAFANSMVWVGVALLSPVIGWASDKIQKRVPLLVITVAIGLICSLILLFVPGIPYFALCLILFVLGGASSGNLICFAAAKDIHRPSVVSTGMAFNNMSVVMSGAIFQPAVGWLISKLWDGTMKDGVPFYSTHDYTLALLAVPISYVLCLVISLFFIKETHCKQYDPYSDNLR